ncbi:hypothetical protein NOCA2570067 [metagenome]|uniref:WD40 repeat protein n=1 Tax=metagenome TaxID=256318 RepID=A0A2P2CB37_9ZZZZ
MNLETRAREAAEGLRAATIADPDAAMPRLRHTHRRRRVARVASAVVLVVGVAGGLALQRDEGDRVISPAHQEDHDPGTGRSSDVVSAAEPGTTDTHLSKTDPAATLPQEVDLLLRDPHTDPLPRWSAFDQATGRFLWTDLPSDPDVVFSGSRTFLVSSLEAGSGLMEVPCPAVCSGIASFGPGPDEITVLVADLEKDRVNPGPESLAQVYGLDGSLRDKIDLAGIMGTRRHVVEATNDWAPPDGSEALVSDLEWSPDGTRLAVATYPGFFEPDCPPGGRPCEALVWVYDQDGGEPIAVHRQSAYSRDDGSWRPPLLTDLAWTSDGSRLGMVVMSDLQDRATRPPSLVGLDVESGRAATLHEFADCGSCRPPRYGFAWSPDGTRLAVTNGDGVSLLASDGTIVSESSDGGPGPLAWLADQG